MATELAERLGLVDDPAPLRFLAEAGWLWLDLGHPEHAEVLFRTLVTLCPDDPTGYLGRGDALLKAGRAKDAAAAFKKATQSPRAQVATLAFGLRKLGDAQMMAGSTRQARSSWVQATETDPAGPDGSLAAERIRALDATPSLDDVDAFLGGLGDRRGPPSTRGSG